jgi:DNA-binding FadR family transcriptional regulator
MRVVQTIRDILYQFIADYFTVMPDTVKNAMDYHIRIYKAIERRNPVEAKKQMESHIQSLTRKMKRMDENIFTKEGRSQSKINQ